MPKKLRRKNKRSINNRNIEIEANREIMDIHINLDKKEEKRSITKNVQGLCM